MKAKLIKTVRIKGKATRPVDGNVTIIDVSDADFARLEAAGAVSKPTKDDLKLAANDSDVSAATIFNVDQAEAVEESKDDLDASADTDAKIEAEASAVVDAKIAGETKETAPRGRKAGASKADKDEDL